VQEQGVDAVTGKTIVKVDPRYFRPTEVDTLLGDPSKAKTKLGWSAKVGFDELVADMVQGDLEHARRDALIAREGFKTYRRHE
jgi:GDPmannose 4,6-dehydratase